MWLSLHRSHQGQMSRATRPSIASWRSPLVSTRPSSASRDGRPAQRSRRGDPGSVQQRRRLLQQQAGRGLVGGQHRGGEDRQVGGRDKVGGDAQTPHLDQRLLGLDGTVEVARRQAGDPREQRERGCPRRRIADPARRGGPRSPPASSRAVRWWAASRKAITCSRSTRGPGIPHPSVRRRPAPHPQRSPRVPRQHRQSWPPGSSPGVVGVALRLGARPQRRSGHGERGTSV